MSSAMQVEIDRNFNHFQRCLSGLLDCNRGTFALLRDQKIHDFFPSVVAAERAGTAKFEDGLFSIQEVTDRPADLGFYTHAFNQR